MYYDENISAPHPISTFFSVSLLLLFFFRDERTLPGYQSLCNINLVSTTASNELIPFQCMTVIKVNTLLVGIKEGCNFVTLLPSFSIKDVKFPLCIFHQTPTQVLGFIVIMKINILVITIITF